MSATAANYSFTEQQFRNVTPARNFPSENSWKSIPRRECMELLHALNYLAQLPDDWNGYGAQKPSQYSIDTTKAFIKLIPENRIYPDKISPDGEGNITLTWDQRPKQRILLTIEGLNLYFSLEKQGKKDFFSKEIPFFGKSIPQEMMNIIPRKNRHYDA